MRSILLASLCVVFVFPLFGQQASYEIRNYGATDLAYSTKDGIIDEDGNQTIIIRKSDQVGLIQFNKDYDLNWGLDLNTDNPIGVRELLQLNNGQYLVILLDKLVLVDAKGKVVWSKIMVSDKASIISFYKGLELSNGNILLILNVGYHKVLTYMSVGGTILKNVEIQGYGLYISDIIETADQHLLMATVQIDSKPGTICHLIKYTYDLKVVWKKRYEHADRILNNKKLMESADGSIYLVGNTNLVNDDRSESDVLISKYSEAGNFVKSIALGRMFYDTAEDLVETADGEILVLGSSRATNNCGNALLAFLLCPDLELLESSFMGEPIAHGSFYSKIHQIRDYYYLFGGGTTYTSIGNNDAHLLITDEHFHFPCFNLDWPVSTTHILKFPEIDDQFSIQINDFHLESEDDRSIVQWNPVITAETVCLGDVFGSGFQNDLASTSRCDESLSSNSKQSLPVDVQLYPNPAAQQVYLSFPIDMVSGKVEIRDQQGKLMLSEDAVTGEVLTIDVSSFQVGIYHVSIFTENQSMPFTELLSVVR